jgi:hypothetical protein
MPSSMANDIWSRLDAYVTHIARTGLTKPENNSRRRLTLPHRPSQSSPQHGYDDERSSMEPLVDTSRPHTQAARRAKQEESLIGY